MQPQFELPIDDPGVRLGESDPATVDRDAERIARAGLSRVIEPGDLGAAQAIAGLSAVEAWDLLRRGGPGWAQWASRVATADPERDLEQAVALGGRFVIPGDPDWPEQLDVLRDCGEVNRRGGAPFGIWVRGEADLRSVLAAAVAVVGARACSAYGEHVAGELAAGLAENGLSVVSGGAYGIDAAAHRGALAVCGVTVAVLACGVDVNYPRGNASLFDRIAATGLLVSEMPPGSSPTRLRFLARNRLIAALTTGTVVVEAAVRSGALNTASWADRCHRVVMAVPGPITSAKSEGSHVLIRERGAVLVTNVGEILEAVAPSGEQLTPYPRGADRVTDQLSEVAYRVLEALPLRRAATEQWISRAAGLSAVMVRTGVTELDGLGLVERVEHGWRLSAQRRAELGCTE